MAAEGQFAAAMSCGDDALRKGWRMKPSRIGVQISSAIFLSLFLTAPQKLCAADLNSQDIAAKIVKQDSGVKAQIKQAKQKIAEEREKILAAGRRLDQVRKTGDKAAIEQAKKEVAAEIKERKSAISVLKSEIEKLQDGGGSLAPGRKGRSKEGQ
jgi:hypothetical protein